MNQPCLTIHYIKYNFIVIHQLATDSTVNPRFSATMTSAIDSEENTISPITSAIDSEKQTFHHQFLRKNFAFKGPALSNISVHAVDTNNCGARSCSRSRYGASAWCHQVQWIRQVHGLVVG